MEADVEMKSAQGNPATLFARAGKAVFSQNWGESGISGPRAENLAKSFILKYNCFTAVTKPQ
jgi:hypothetical protein